MHDDKEKLRLAILHMGMIGRRSQLLIDMAEMNGWDVDLVDLTEEPVNGHGIDYMVIDDNVSSVGDDSNRLRELYDHLDRISTEDH